MPGSVLALLGGEAPQGGQLLHNNVFLNDLSHSCTNFVNRMVKAHNQAAEQLPMEQRPWSNSHGVQVPTNQAFLGRAWMVKPQRLNNPALEQALGHYLGMPVRGLSP